MHCSTFLAAAALFALASAPLDTGWTHDENSGFGYSYFSARTFVDCKNTRVGYRQSADIFTGGYTHDAAGRELSYADMGILLENDDLKRGEIGRPNKVQLYGQGATDGGKDLLRFSQTGNAPQRFFNVVCDTPIELTFWVESKTAIAIRYDGTFASKYGGKRFTGSLEASIEGFAPADGWSVACERCAVRRVDTLAVSSDGPTRAGAYFAIRTVLGAREPSGYWTGAVAGRYVGGPAGVPQSYAMVPFSARRRDIVDTPPDGQRVPAGRPAFLIRHQGEPNEVFGLDQR